MGVDADESVFEAGEVLTFRDFKTMSTVGVAWFAGSSRLGCKECGCGETGMDDKLMLGGKFC